MFTDQELAALRQLLNAPGFSVSIKMVPTVASILAKLDAALLGADGEPKAPV